MADKLFDKSASSYKLQHGNVFNKFQAAIRVLPFLQAPSFKVFWPQVLNPNERSVEDLAKHCYAKQSAVEREQTIERAKQLVRPGHPCILTTPCNHKSDV